MMTRLQRLVLAGAMLTPSLAAAAPAPQDDSQSESISSFSVPLTDGHVKVQELVQKLSTEFNLELPAPIAELDWSIDVQGVIGRTQLRAIERLADGAVSIDVEHDQLVVTIDRAKLHQAFVDAERKARRWVNAKTASKSDVDSFGLTYFNATYAAPTPRHAVVLVHGLDDPGMMWDDLIPQLQTAGHRVAIFRYPNDGPIAESADLLGRTLEAERKNGLRHVDVVAHSMGGLVVRDVLTRPAHYGGDGTGGERFPSIDRFIMIGTPNHGARMARFRFITQAGEQVSRLMQGQGLAPAETGSGEAGIDLLPGSDFLRRLNDRPLARHTRHTNIISQWITVESDRLARFFEGALDAVEATSDDPAWRKWLSRENMEAVAQRVQDAGDSLGDGCVSIESARLEGVDDFVLLRGNHVSVLWNGPLSDEMPPVVPVVLDRLSPNKSAAE